MVELAQLIFRVVRFMIAVIMIQDQLRVATLNKWPKSKKYLNLLCHTKKSLHVFATYAQVHVGFLIFFQSGESLFSLHFFKVPSTILAFMASTARHNNK